MRIAIVTGASSGLGEEYVRIISEQYEAIDEIWVIARRGDRLEALKEKYPAKAIFPISLDLTKNESYKTLSEMLESEKPEVGILVNNAGFGTLGDFDEMELSSQTRMVDLNKRLLHRFLCAKSQNDRLLLHQGLRSFLLQVSAL